MTTHISSNKSKTTVALFNYGGGMRGLIPAHFMARLEKITGLRMADMVDIFTGPSTGAILNGALTLKHPDKPGRPKYRARHLINFYEREGVNIFPQDDFREFRGIIHDFNNRTLKLGQLNALFRHGHYDPKYLGRALKTLYGDAKLGDSLNSLIIPTYNIDGEQIPLEHETGETDDMIAHHGGHLIDEGGHALWLKHIQTDTPKGIKNQTPEVSLYDAVMASCAAPSYFPCHHFEMCYPGSSIPVSYSGIDGVIFDNPCISYLGAIRRHIPKDHKLIMIILGTGYTNLSVKKEDWNRYGALGIVDPVNDLPLINIFFHASESALMDSFAEEMGESLFIFNKPMIQNREDLSIPNTQIDDATLENTEALKQFSYEMMEDHSKEFEEICHILVDNYDQKQSNTDKSSVKDRIMHFMPLMPNRHKDEKG